MHPSRSLASFVLVFCLAGCGDSSGPSTALKESDILGTWTLSAEAGTGDRQCGVIPPLLLPFVSGGADLGDGRLQFVDSWYFASNPSKSYGVIAAQISTRDGSARIQLNRTLDEATLIEGTMHSGGTFDGTITDPAPGKSGSAVFVSFGGLSPCTYRIAMTKAP